MAYNSLTVVIGGLVHVPIVIGLLKTFDNITVKGYLAEKAAREQAEAKAKAEAEAQRLKEAQMQAEAEAKAKAKAEAEAKAKSSAPKPPEGET